MFVKSKSLNESESISRRALCEVFSFGVVSKCSALPKILCGFVCEVFEIGVGMFVETLRKIDVFVMIFSLWCL